MGILDGKTALIFGVANDHSIAWGIAQAFHREGAKLGFVYTVDWDGAPVVRQRMHWVACEGIAAAVALEKATGEDRFAEAAAMIWEYVARFAIERPGAWRHELSPANQPAGETWPGKPDIYHALQAVLLPGLPLAPSFAPALAQQREHR